MVMGIGDEIDCFSRQSTNLLDSSTIDPVFGTRSLRASPA